MTSEDTHARTLALLEANAYFGATPEQVTLIKQEKVACLAGELLLAEKAAAGGGDWGVEQCGEGVAGQACVGAGSKGHQQGRAHVLRLATRLCPA